MTSPSTPEDASERFLKFHYAELKDLGKHFLTISSASLVFIITFMDKMLRASTLPPVLVRASLIALIVAAICAGVGLFTNFVAGAGASGAIIWGLGSEFQTLTKGTYSLFLIAGGSMVGSLALLTLQAFWL